VQKKGKSRVMMIRLTVGGEFEKDRLAKNSGEEHRHQKQREVTQRIGGPQGLLAYSRRQAVGGKKLGKEKKG